MVPLRYYAGTFSLDGRVLRLSTARGTPPLIVRLSRDVPYPPAQVRSVTLAIEAGRLVVQVTAEVPVAEAPGAGVAGVDPGIIHPFAVATADRALLVSGRAIRAEERLHLADTKARQRVMSNKAPKRGQRGSRRWRKLRAAQRRAEARHRRRVHQMHHEAAQAVVSWAVEQGVGTLMVGDPVGIATKDSGRRQNRRVATTWRRTHLIGALSDKAELAGITVIRTDERGTSSTCPSCHQRTPKPRGRNFTCPHCGERGHRDIVGARNIAARGGGSTTAPAVVTHRRAGRPPARRDRRRHLMDVRRSCPAPGRPDHVGESLVGTLILHQGSGLVGDDRRRGSDSAHVV